MKSILISLFILVLLLGGCRPLRESRQKVIEPKKVTPSPAAAGEGIFNQRCAVCHKIKGQGGTDGPDLSKIGATRSANWLKKWLKDPKAVKADAAMPNLNLSDRDISRLVSYLSAQK